MDLSLIMEVLRDKGYMPILEGCVAAIVLLLMIRYLAPGLRPGRLKIDYSITKEKLFLNEEFEVRLDITARKKAMIEELAFYVECLLVIAPGGSKPKRKSYYFDKHIVNKSLAIYPRCSVQETLKLKIPERFKEGYLPGTFTSLKGEYSIEWNAGYSIKLDDSYEYVKGNKKIRVFPATAGW